MDVSDFTSITWCLLISFWLTLTFASRKCHSQCSCFVQEARAERGKTVLQGFSMVFLEELRKFAARLCQFWPTAKAAMLDRDSTNEALSSVLLDALGDLTKITPELMVTKGSPRKLSLGITMVAKHCDSCEPQI